MGINVSNTEIMNDSRVLTVRNLSIDSNGYIGAESAPAPTTSPLLATNFGYVSGGFNLPAIISNIIERFSVTSTTNSTDVGDLYITTRGHAGHSSETNGYASAGQIGISGSTETNSSIIQRFAFSSTISCVFVGSLINGRYRQQGISSPTHGYTALGIPVGVLGLSVPATLPGFTAIEKFPFFTEMTTVMAGTVNGGTGKSGAASHSSDINGYISGGTSEPYSALNVRTTIDKFPFAIDVGSARIGDLTQARAFVAGHSSSTHGYASGGAAVPSPRFSTIDKFSFSVDSNATTVGDLFFGVSNHAGVSSLNNGFSIGGTINPSNITNAIQRFSFASDANAQDVADCVLARDDMTDHSD